MTASLAATSPAMFQRAGTIRDLLAAGLPVKVAVASFGSGVATVEVTSGGTKYRFTPSDNTAKPLLWSANGGLPEASLVLYGPAVRAMPAAPVKPVAGKPVVAAPVAAAVAPTGEDAPPGPELARIATEGPWALFRLMGKTRVANAGPTTLKAAFGTGAASAVLGVTLPGDANPFARSGPWAFRCPATL